MDCCQGQRWALIGDASDAISQAFDFVHTVVLRFFAHVHYPFHSGTLESSACDDVFDSFPKRFVA